MSAAPSRPPRQPLRWQGVVFAFAANLLLVTGGDALARQLQIGINAELLATIVGPLIAGAATALYIRNRGGMHALLGALISLPIIAFVIFPTAWPLAVFAAAFCTMGGAITEILLRRRG